MLNGSHIAVQLTEVLLDISCQSLGNVGILLMFKHLHAKDISFLIIISIFRIKIPIPFIDPVVGCNLAMISDKLNLHLFYLLINPSTFSRIAITYESNCISKNHNSTYIPAVFTVSGNHFQSDLQP